MRQCLINFAARHVPLVEAGIKPHTIRPMRGDDRDPLPGDTLHLYAGMGTKKARLVRSEACEYTRTISIQASVGNVHHILLGSDLLGQHDVEMLARNDGFANAAELIQFVADTYGLPFTGILIGWTPTPTFTTRH